ncbi:MAG: SIMPL domain-containing protein [Caulobacterales bacterium]|jgi:uncharacterized protein YggE
MRTIFKTSAAQISALAAAVALAFSGAAGAQETMQFSQPYWTQRPVIETIGMAEVEFAPNRATFSVTFQGTDDTAEGATRKATDAARRGVQAVRARAGQNVRISSQMQVQALYEQYRDREGNRIDNARADQISGYVANATLMVTIDDAGQLSRASEARAAAMAAGPQSTSPLQLSLVTTPEMRRTVYERAMEDAVARARLAAGAAGQRLGTLLVAQDGQGPCLGQWFGVSGGVSSFRGPPPPPPPPMMASAMDQIVVTGSGRAPAITVADIEALNLPADPEPLRLSGAVCLVYAIAP